MAETNPLFIMRVMASTRHEGEDSSPPVIEGQHTYPTKNMWLESYDANAAYLGPGSMIVRRANAVSPSQWFEFWDAFSLLMQRDRT